MAANLYSEDYEQSVVEGFVKHNYVRHYKVDVTTNLVVTTNDPGLPALLSPVIIGGDTYYCVRKIPRRHNDEGGRTLAMVACYYSNDAGSFLRNSSGQPVSNAENMAPYVQVEWMERVQEQNTAVFLRIEDGDGTAVAAPPYLASMVGRFSYCVNSANNPVGYFTKAQHFKQIIYWTFHRTWSESWEDGLDTVNSAAFTVTQSDPYGVRLLYNIPIHNALFVDLLKEDHWKGDKLYFRRGIVMHIDDNAWVHRIPDKGMQVCTFMGQTNFGVEPQRLYTQTEIDDEFASLGIAKSVKYSQRDIGMLTKDGQTIPISEPVALNGFGAMRGVRRPDSIGTDKSNERYTLVYDPFEQSNWPSTLGIT